MAYLPGTGPTRPSHWTLIITTAVFIAVILCRYSSNVWLSSMYENLTWPAGAVALIFWMRWVYLMTAARSRKD